MNKLSHAEELRRAWDEHTNLISAITAVYQLRVWFTLTNKEEQDCSWRYFERTTMAEFVNAKSQDKSILEKCNLIVDEEVFCRFTLSSNNSAVDVMAGYEFLKRMAGELKLNINYEAV